MTSISHNKRKRKGALFHILQVLAYFVGAVGVLALAWSMAFLILFAFV